MCGHLKEWLCIQRICFVTGPGIMISCFTSSNFAPLSSGFSNIYSPGASYAVKVTQYLQKLRTPTGKFDVHTLTGNNHLWLAFTYGMVCTRCVKSSVIFSLGTCKQDLEKNLLPPLSVEY